MWERYIAQQKRAGSEATCKQFWVVCNKLDLFEECGKVPIEEGKAWSTEIGATFHRASARTGEGFEELGRSIAEAILDARGVACGVDTSK